MQRRELLAGMAAAAGAAPLHGKTAKPALLGGEPVRKKPFPGWPVVQANDERAVLEVLRGGKWFRGYGKQVDAFESAYASLTGARHCLATANGTSALIIALNVLDIGPGDEVIVPPYTFIATVNAVLSVHALPVFADTDRDTFQMDPKSIEARISPRTAAILPVHLGGNVAEMDAILAIANRHGLPVIEDACQAHMAEWKNRKAGTLGRMGCFSFQASKNLNAGEGGAVLTDDPELAERCFAYHNNSRGRRPGDPVSRGVNLRLTEFQAALLQSQMTRLSEQTKRREENAAYLTERLSRIPGIKPARMYAGCTRNAYHLYMFRYEADGFGGLTRDRFRKALSAEGIPSSSGYAPLNQQPFLRNTFESKRYQRIYSEAELKRWAENNRCEANDRLCREGVWFTQAMLLGDRRDMDDIVTAVTKIHDHAGDLTRDASSG